jgi:hypothetical protein
MWVLNGAGADLDWIGKLEAEVDDCIEKYIMMMYQPQS